MKRSMFLAGLCMLTLATNANADCYKERNARGNMTLKCDTLDEYPDKNPNDNYPNSWNRGHQAGADWAKRNNIRHPNDCSGWSRSFVQGCMIQANK